jgi:hypothetical protein
MEKIEVDKDKNDRPLQVSGNTLSAHLRESMFACGHVRGSEKYRHH